MEKQLSSQPLSYIHTQNKHYLGCSTNSTNFIAVTAAGTLTKDSYNILHQMLQDKNRIMTLWSVHPYTEQSAFSVANRA